MSLDISKIKQEFLVFLRNSDILSTTIRGVTTTTATGTLSGTDTITIAVTNVKNIRSVSVASVSKSIGTDYEVNYDHATGCVITFTSNQTGDYSVSYDYGTDKIYPDFPRDDLTINSYPRIGFDITNINNAPFGIGGSQFIGDVTFMVLVYDDKTDDIDNYIKAINDAVQTNAKSFYYLSFVFPSITGPLILSPERNDEIMHRSQDIIGRFNVT